jgi:hypothetical protein
MSAVARTSSSSPTRPTRVLTFVEFVALLLEVVLTPAQRTLARVVFDGVDPIDLEDPEERKLAAILFGDVQRISERARRRIIVFRLGRWSGKTTLCAARALFRMCTADLSRCGPGDIPMVAVIAPRTETAQAMMQMARYFASLPKIKPMVVQSAKQGFTLRRPQDGREVVFKVIPKSQGGSAVRGFSLVDVIIDESEFVAKSGADAKVSDTDIVDAVMPRLLPGAHLMFVSTPWPAPSETSRVFEENFGKPSTAVAAMAPTPVMRDNDAALMQLIADELERKPQNAEREFFCKLIDGAGGAFFEVSSLERAMAIAPEPARKSKSSAGIDPAFVHDSSALAIVERRGDARAAFLDAVHLEFVSPTPERPLVPSEVVRSFAATVRAHGTRILATDVHKVKIVRSNAAAVGVQVYQGPLFAEAAIYLREILREGKLRLPFDPKLLKQLKSVTYRPKSGGGLHVEAPRSLEDGHADLVAALAMAVFFDGVQFGPLVKAEGRTGNGSGEGSKPFVGLGPG